MIRELALPVFDAYTLPGSSFGYSIDPETGKCDASVVHQRERGAPKRSLYTAGPKDLEREISMFESRKRVDSWLREKGLQGIDGPAIYNDIATAEVLRGAWIADGTSFSNSTVENAVAQTPQFAGSGAAIETITTGGEAVGGFWYQGRTIRILWEPVVSSATAAPGTLILNARLNSHTGNAFGASATTATLATSMATIAQQVQLWATCRTIGAAGALEVAMNYTTVAGTVQTGATVNSLNRGAVTIDTTANNNIVMTALFSVAAATNIILTKLFLVEVLN